MLLNALLTCKMRCWASVTNMPSCDSNAVAAIRWRTSASRRLSAPSKNELNQLTNSLTCGSDAVGLMRHPGVSEPS